MFSHFCNNWQICEPQPGLGQWDGDEKHDILEGTARKRGNVSVRCPWVNPCARYWNLTTNWLKPDTAWRARECQHPVHNVFNSLWDPQSPNRVEVQNNLKYSRHSSHKMSWRSTLWHIEAMFYLDRNQINPCESVTLNTFIHKKNAVNTNIQVYFLCKSIYKTEDASI